MSKIPLIKICDQSPSNWVCNGIPPDRETEEGGSSSGTIELGDLIIEEPPSCITIITSDGLELLTQANKAICIEGSGEPETPVSTCIGINTNDSFRITTHLNEPICTN